jgi:site-specific recombinase XerD
MIYEQVSACIKFETERGIAKTTLKELSRYLHEFADYCQQNQIIVEQVSSDFMRQYVQYRGRGLGPNLIKAVVWSLRKFGAFLVLQNILFENPARPLRHPKMSPRSQLPKYLSESELKALLHSAAQKLNKRDFAIVGLICSTGMRPFSVAALKREHFFASDSYIFELTKGAGYRKAALNTSLVSIISEYLANRSDDHPALFVNNRNQPVSKSWVQRLVKKAGQDAGLTVNLNCNMLRHSFAVHSSDRHGKSITKALMGHHKLATTAVYTHLSAKRFRGLMNLHAYNKPDLRSLK